MTSFFTMSSKTPDCILKMIRRMSGFPRSNITPQIQLVPKFDSKVIEDVKSNKYKPRHHPGRRVHVVIQAPKEVIEASKIIISKEEEKNIVTDGIAMIKYLTARILPTEKNNLVENMFKYREEALTRIGLKDVDLEETYNDQDLRLIEGKVKREVKRTLKQRTYNWTPVDYTDYIAKVYLIARFAPEYAVLLKVLHDIVKILPDFKPNSVFDFGSGVGTVLWACHNYWAENIFEYYCVDTSPAMADLSELILQGGRENKHPYIRNVTYRQFFPAATKNKYSLVFSAFSLLELPSQKDRLQTVKKLWDKTEDFLIIVEKGNVSGFQSVQEARDFILSTNVSTPGTAHVFAPCPHDVQCPKAFLSNHCNFSIRYEPITYKKGEKIAPRETYSYVILRKGKRRDLPEWPRIVRPVLKRSKHTICKMCTSSGHLKQIGFTKRKHGMFEYRCVKGSKWGDLLPVTLEEQLVEEEDDEIEAEQYDMEDPKLEEELYKEDEK